MSDRHELGRRMAEQLYAAERAVDLAVAEVSDLAAMMTRGRMEHGIAAVVGQEALERVVECSGVLTRARRALVDGHRQLARDARAMQIAWTALGGPGETKPAEDGPRVGAVGRLRQVA
ncbi:hypothetical protein [Brevundimonas viscosa]|uniref:Uncharacterized protein n=1 Tax=Brevundimonas viscosa TaxID=871741 RepID=A0A1I6RZB6_9CAUL|nr:hypothetical protein [Brevundimonas viscosa]SFS70016.1 hypothetical protein SAMN05192570_2030 [Brevundimonas viscosa]